MPETKNLKGKFLMEVVEKYNQWMEIGTPEALQYAAAYEKLMCAFTTPDKKG